MLNTNITSNTNKDLNNSSFTSLISSKITKIIDNLNLLGYKLETDEEILVDLIKKENFKFQSDSSRENLEKIYRLLVKYIKARLIMCYHINKRECNSNYLKNSRILISKDYESKTKLVIFIPDRQTECTVLSKVSLIYGSVRKGSIINFVEQAVNANYSVLLLNPLRKDKKDKSKVTKQFDHFDYCEAVYDEFVFGKDWIKSIVFIVNKLGSFSLFKLMTKFKEDFKSKVKKIILLNSSHNSMYEALSPEMKLEFEKKCTNYITSNSPEGSLLYSASESNEGCENRSTGTLNESFSYHLIKDEIGKFLI